MYIYYDLHYNKYRSENVYYQKRYTFSLIDYQKRYTFSLAALSLEHILNKYFIIATENELLLMEIIDI